MRLCLRLARWPPWPTLPCPFSISDSFVLLSDPCAVTTNHLGPPLHAPALVFRTRQDSAGSAVTHNQPLQQKKCPLVECASKVGVATRLLQRGPCTPPPPSQFWHQVGSFQALLGAAGGSTLLTRSMRYLCVAPGFGSARQAGGAPREGSSRPWRAYISPHGPVHSCLLLKTGCTQSTTKWY